MTCKRETNSSHKPCQSRVVEFGPPPHPLAVSSLLLSVAFGESFAGALSLPQTPESDPSDISDIYVKDFSQCRTVELA